VDSVALDDTIRLGWGCPGYDQSVDCCIDDTDVAWCVIRSYITGTYKSWYLNGIVRSENNYVYGKRYIIKDYYPDGILYIEYNFNTDIQRQWYPNGKIKGIFNIDKKHELHGLQKVWYENGNLHKEYNKKHGKKDGILRIWNEDGNIIRDEFYYNGELVDKLI